MAGDAVMRLCMLDLRDVTARAHAAWRYFGPDGMIPALVAEIERQGTAGWLALKRYVDILYRMRCGDESVTVAEARAALGWAESVAGVSDGA